MTAPLAKATKLEPAAAPAEPNTSWPASTSISAP